MATRSQAILHYLRIFVRGWIFFIIFFLSIFWMYGFWQKNFYNNFFLNFLIWFFLPRLLLFKYNNKEISNGVRCENEHGLYLSRAVFVLMAITHSSPHDLSTVHWKRRKYFLLINSVVVKCNILRFYSRVTHFYDAFNNIDLFNHYWLSVRNITLFCYCV